MNNIIYKIKNLTQNLTLEQVNKNLMLLALLSLIYRIGNFYNTYIPKPFEIILVLIIFLTLIDLVINKKFKEFFSSIGQKVWVALSCLVASVFIGWFVAVFVKNIPINLNVILEFGTFMISVVIFVLILFYAKDDQVYLRRYLYALLLPAVYTLFVLFVPLARYFYLEADGSFLGLTMNPNIISKILLIPALFFITCSLFKSKNKWIRLVYIVVSSALVALLFWVGSRGGLITLVFSLMFVWLVFSLHKFNWKKLFSSGVLILAIFILGFIVTPESGKQRVFLRVLYPGSFDHSSYFTGIDKSTNEVVTKLINDKSSNHLFIYPERENRFKIWPFYLKYVLENPLGIGPNTHHSFGLRDSNGEYINSGPHNTFLQIWFWGGLLGILGFLYIFISACKNLLVNLRSNFNPMGLALLSILFALSLSMMFDDSLSFFWFFIILALALRYEHTTN
jgi:O-antigen ligase